MPPSTFRDQLHKLESLGYIVPGKGNLYHFYETPGRVTRSEENEHEPLNSHIEKNTAPVQEPTAPVHQSPPEDIEIYINNKNIVTNIPREVDEYAKHKTIDERKKEFNF